MREDSSSNVRNVVDNRCGAWLNESMNNTAAHTTPAGTALAAKCADEAQFSRIVSAILDETMRLARLELAAGATYAEALATGVAKAAEASPALAAIVLEILAPVAP